MLDVTDDFNYLGTTITSDLSLDREIDKRIAKAAGVMAKLSKTVWDNPKVYQACVIGTLLHGSEFCTT